MENMISVLLVEPEKRPKVIQIKNELKVMQNLVGGYIETIMPFEDEVALVCNENGKNEGLSLNRAIYFENSDEIADIIAGTFFICYAPADSEDFESLPEELAKKYEKMFEKPELFFIDSDEKIKAIKYEQR